MPKYPSYPSQPFTGNLLTGKQGGPPDARITGGAAPYYNGPLTRQFRRQLAGDDDVAEQATNPSTDNAYAVNELEHLREMDDVQGDGIFDPPGTHPNVYADAGVFAGRWSLPGYHVREVPFKFSEVRDATTGRPIIPVPSGAVSLDTPVKLAQLERNAYAPAQPVVWSNRGGHVVEESIVNWAQNPEPVKGLGRWGGIGADAAAPPTEPDTTKIIVGVIGAGLLCGLAFALVNSK